MILDKKGWIFGWTKCAHDYVYDGLTIWINNMCTWLCIHGLTICAQDFIYKGVDYLGCTVCPQDHRSRGWLYGRYAQYVHKIMDEGVDYLVFTNLCTRGCIVKKSHIGCKLQHWSTPPIWLHISNSNSFPLWIWPSH